jgi:galactokinase
MARLRPEVRALRDVAVEDLDWAEGVLDEVSFRRTRHVVTENARVLATVGALAAGEFEALGRLFAESHASLRDDYEVSSAELDLLVEIAARTSGVVAARMTGGGFGGCTVNLVRPEGVDRLRKAVLREYPGRTGLSPTVFPLEAVAGAGVLGPAPVP